MKRKMLFMLLIAVCWGLGINVYATNYRPVRSNIMVTSDSPSHSWSSSDFCDECEDSVMRNIFSKADFGDHGIYYKYIEAFDGTNGTGNFDLGFCTESTVGFPNRFGRSTTDFYKSEDVQVVDKGIAYIIKNGFTTKFIKSSSGSYYSGNSSNDPYYKNRLNYWITQMAIWWYTDGGIPNIQAKTTKPELYNQIKALYDGAVAEKNGTTNTMLPILFVEDSTMSLENDYYVSDLIELKYAEENYTVSLDNENFEVVDQDNNPKTQFGLNEKFKVRINKNNINDLTGVKITATTNTKTRYGNQFVNNSIQNLAVLHYGTAERKPTLNLTLSVSCPLSFKVVDDITNANVCSGTFNIVDMNNQPISDINGNPIGDIVLSNSNCHPSYTLPNGKYKIKQKTVAEGFYNNNGDVTVNMETSCADEVIIHNSPLCAVNINVIDKETNSKVCQGTIVVRDKDGNIAKDANGHEVGRVSLTDDNCHISLDVPKGEYSVVQETQDYPYIKDNTSYTVNTETTCPVTVNISNERYYAISIIKKDHSTGKVLPNATLVLEDDKGTVIKEFQTTEEKEVIDHLLSGVYYLSEKVAPKGYTLIEEKMMIEVGPNKDIDIVFYNDKINVPITSKYTKFIGIGLSVGAIGLSLVMMSHKKKKVLNYE